MLIDSTVKEKNITYPTDAKLHKRIIEKVNEIAKQEEITLRQTYTRTLKQLMIDHHPKRRKKAKAAFRKIKTIAGRQVRDIERQFSREQKIKYEGLMVILNKILSQQKGDKNKKYSNL
jgi:IS5 family transposase